MVNKKKYIFDDPKNIKRLLTFLYACCALLFILDFVIHRHVFHYWENLWAFYPIYGFVSCIVLVLIATWMRTFLMRPEDYYDDEMKDYKKENNQGENLDQHNMTKMGEHNVDV